MSNSEEALQQWVCAAYCNGHATASMKVIADDCSTQHCTSKRCSQCLTCSGVV